MVKLLQNHKAWKPYNKDKRSVDEIQEMFRLSMSFRLQNSLKLLCQEKPLAYWRMTDTLAAEKSFDHNMSFWEFLTSKRSYARLIVPFGHLNYIHTLSTALPDFLCLACRDRWLGVPMARNFSAAYTAKTAKKHSNTRKCRTSSEFE